MKQCVKLLGVALFCLSTATSNSFAHPRDFFDEYYKKTSRGALEFGAYMSSLEQAEIGLDLNKTLDDDMQAKLMLVTSAANNCLRCVCVAVKKLTRLKVEKSLIASLQGDVKNTKMSLKDKALLNVAKVLTLDPKSSPTAIKAAKVDGWTDHEVLMAILVTTHYNSMNRINLALELPPDKKHPYKMGQKLPISGCG